MTPVEAKFILTAARGEGARGISEPELAEALRIAASDPGLREWLRAERRFDTAVRGRLASVSPPAGLRAEILAGRKVSRFRRPWWNPSPQTWTLVAAAAVLLLLVGWLVGFGNRPATPEIALQEVARYLDDEWDHGFDIRATDLKPLRDWVAAQSTQERFEVSAALGESPTFGCRVFRWRGHRATLICFAPRGVGDVVHVVSLPRSAFAGVVPELPAISSVGSWNGATWGRGDRVYVALTTAASDALLRML